MYSYSRATRVLAARSRDKYAHAASSATIAANSSEVERHFCAGLPPLANFEFAFPRRRDDPSRAFVTRGVPARNYSLRLRL